VFVVGEVFGEVFSVFVAKELVEDIDGGGAEEGFVVVAAVFVEGAGRAAVELAAVAVAELIAGAFGGGLRSSRKWRGRSRGRRRRHPETRQSAQEREPYFSHHTRQEL